MHLLPPGKCCLANLGPSCDKILFKDSSNEVYTKWPAGGEAEGTVAALLVAYRKSIAYKLSECEVVESTSTTELCGACVRSNVRDAISIS